MSGLTISYLKKIFWSNLCVGSSFQLLGILKYACGLNLGPAFLYRLFLAGDLEQKSYF